MRKMNKINKQNINIFKKNLYNEFQFLILFFKAQ